MASGGAGTEMKVLKHDDQPLEAWRVGVMTRMRVSALAGGHQLCIFDQFCDPGHGAPMHAHTVEEVLEVINGVAEICLDGDAVIVTDNQSIVIPAGVMHRFENVDRDKRLHVRATLAAPIFEASYCGRDEVSRRWVPEDFEIQAHGVIR
jgi:mannose-6-phosphate isomerase-like protein (cupin superfamily)